MPCDRGAFHNHFFIPSTNPNAQLPLEKNRFRSKQLVHSNALILAKKNLPPGKKIPDLGLRVQPATLLNSPDNMKK